jgi:hypothetical protein
MTFKAIWFALLKALQMLVGTNWFGTFVVAPLGVMPAGPQIRQGNPEQAGVAVVQAIGAAKAAHARVSWYPLESTGLN